MAIVKHIKSRNANYSAAINYLLFEHDEKTGKKIVDESGRSILRKEFYMDGLNCDPMSFDKECELTNAHFHKNKKREDIKSHHYIISYDPADVTENGLTGKRAQAIMLPLFAHSRHIAFPPVLVYSFGAIFGKITVIEPSKISRSISNRVDYPPIRLSCFGIISVSVRQFSPVSFLP